MLLIEQGFACFLFVLPSCSISPLAYRCLLSLVLAFIASLASKSYNGVLPVCNGLIFVIFKACL
ncbi:uncharacterized protein B0P05DRAFT_537197 [Gilbertella persicaria]|uniref:uncharacterized protein n=1 Tax=Gilbertella persicaria TaxID=101096 RepID=UPI00222089CC|nr:uncharacterized protein B0P05DRAFT_537197 [Gilbertella persicaria]KAI8082475.1 hypothetical protein B0P05DRAFT_537197 [Gilbertella persicaria]